MTVESATYISDLNASNPASGDSLVEGDDHLRLVKSTVKATFPNVSGAVTPTHTELNYVDGVTQSIQPVLSGIGLVFLSEQSASASASINFTTGLDSTYEEYVLEIINAVPTSSKDFQIRTSVDAGSNYASTSGDYDWTVLESKGTATSVINGSTTATGITLTDTSVSATADYGGLNLTVRIANPAGTTAHKMFSWSGSAGTSATAGNIAIIQGAGSRRATAAINAFQILAASAETIASGKFKLYGVRKS